MKKFLISAIFSLSVFTNFGQTTGISVYDDSFIHEIRMNFSQVDHIDSLTYYYDQYLNFNAPKKYMVATVEIDGVIVDSVGVRQKGFYSNWGSSTPKKPFKINFKTYTDQRFDGLNKLNLQNGFSDPTLMRDALAYKFLRDNGVNAPRTAHCKLYINNVYWGVYIIVEQVDSRFLKHGFNDNDGNLFKCIDNTVLKYYGVNSSAYQNEIELKTNELANDWSGFTDLVGRINNTSAFDNAIESIFDIDQYLKVLAADVLMLNWDSYYYHGRNFYLYEDSTTRKFQWIPWDYNLAFSDQTTNIVIPSTNFENDQIELIKSVMEADVYRKRYFNHMCIMLEETFNLAHLEAWIDEQQAMISSAVSTDPHMEFSFAEFNDNFSTDVSRVSQWGGTEVFPGLKSFIANRYQVVQNQFLNNQHVCTSLNVDVIQVQEEFNIYPNPASSTLTIEVAENTQKVSIFSMEGKLVYEINNPNEKINIDIENFRKGIYVVKLQGFNTSSNAKLTID